MVCMSVSLSLPVVSVNHTYKHDNFKSIDAELIGSTGNIPQRKTFNEFQMEDIFSGHKGQTHPDPLLFSQLPPAKHVEN